MVNQPSKERYAAKFPKSKALFETAKGTFPRGVPHDGWNVLPFPIFMTKAKGSHVWDVDGYDHIDYYGGHGGKVLGHAHPAVVEAAKKQIENGMQYGSCCDLSLEWAELIKKLVPSAERVEFTNSGTEAVMMGIRMARAFTGRRKIVRFQFHYSGGYDAVLVGYKEPFDVPISAGVLPAAIENTIVIPANNEQALEDSLKKGDVAALMVEAAGSSSGVVGIKPSFYQTMRDLAKKYGTLLFFDEVVTGFRYSPGGVQGAMGIVPDLTALGKGVNGVVPGAGAIVGCKEVMDMLIFKDDNWNRYNRVSHFGTFNANPLCAATGIAYLRIIATGEPAKKANENARMLRDGMQRKMDERGMTGCVYDSGFSVLHVYIGKCDLQGQCDRIVCLNADKVRSPDVGESLYINLALNGVKAPSRGFDLFVSAVHTKDDINKTIEAFGISLDVMVKENRLPK
ncbi:MAG: aspartate aminotransferase family protein [Thermodesulfobacteriota bacterium]